MVLFPETIFWAFFVCSPFFDHEPIQSPVWNMIFNNFWSFNYDHFKLVV